MLRYFFDWVYRTISQSWFTSFKQFYIRFFTDSLSIAQYASDILVLSGNVIKHVGRPSLALGGCLSQEESEVSNSSLAGVCDWMEIT